MPWDPPQVVKLGEVTLDLAQGRLHGPQGEIALRAKSFAFLAFLTRNRGRVIGKDELLAAVWPGLTVTDESLTQCAHDVRRALGVAGAALLRTVPRRGYVLDGGSAPGVVPGSLAVMPFRLTGPDAARDQVLFDGLAHDVISHLARLKAFHVTGRGTSFALRDRADDPVGLGQTISVAYVVTGRALRLDDRFRLHVDLIACANGAVIWSDVMDLGLDAVMHASRGLSDPIVAAVAREVTAQERRLAQQAGGDQSPDAWRLFHMGLNLIFRFDAPQMAAALAHFEAAIALDPGFTRAHAFASFCHYFFAFTDLGPGRAVAMTAALATAAQAMTLDDTSPVSLWAQGRALWLKGDAEEGLRCIRQAVALCPSFPHAHYMAGFIEAHQGDASRALDDLAVSERLSPFDPFLASIQITRAVALTRLGDLQGAAVWAARAARQQNAYGQLRCNAALILAATGQVTEARCIMAAVRAAEPAYRPASLFTAIPMMPEMRGLLQQELEALER